MLEQRIASARRAHRLPAIALTTAMSAALFVATASTAGATASTTTASTTTATPAAMARSVASLINAERKAHHLAAVRVSVRLTRSAHLHNLAMAHYNTMSHQLPHEAGLGTRITKTTFPWHSCGENIGWNSQLTTAGARQLETMMYNEKAPNDGHRRNILAKQYRWVGVDILIDTAHHKLWLTTDYADGR